MQLYLIRHAHAGQRRQDGRDIYRSLSDEGHDRAAELSSVLADRALGRILSSPATRCVQTVEPLATVCGLDVEERPELWEGSSIDDVFSLFDSLGGEDMAACSHGDIIPDVIDRLNRGGVPISGRGCELGSIWILEFDGSDCQGARYAGRNADALA